MGKTSGGLRHRSLRSRSRRESAAVGPSRAAVRFRRALRHVRVSGRLLRARGGRNGLASVLHPNSLVALMFAARFTSVACLPLTLLIAYGIFKRLKLSETTALLCTIGVAWLPLTSWVSGYVQPDNLTTLLLTASLYVALRWKAEPERIAWPLWLSATLVALGFVKQHYAGGRDLRGLCRRPLVPALAQVVRPIGRSVRRADRSHLSGGQTRTGAESRVPSLRRPTSGSAPLARPHFCRFRRRRRERRACSLRRRAGLYRFLDGLRHARSVGLRRTVQRSGARCARGGHRRNGGRAGSSHVVDREANSCRRKTPIVVASALPPHE